MTKFYLKCNNQAKKDAPPIVCAIEQHGVAIAHTTTDDGVVEEISISRQDAIDLAELILFKYNKK